LGLLVSTAVAGALGALARYEVEGFVSDRVSTSFPFGTLVVNISGSFLLGLLFTLFADRFATPAWIRTALTVGFISAYTTFSTFEYETFSLIDSGVPIRALLNVLASIVLGLLAVFMGVLVARTI